MAAEKVTLTLPEDLLAVIDQFVANHVGVTRSGVCADALLAWLQGQQEAEIERYYLSVSDEERAEDDFWRSAATQSRCSPGLADT